MTTVDANEVAVGIESFGDDDAPLVLRGREDEIVGTVSWASARAGCGVVAQDIPDRCRETWRTPSAVRKGGRSDVGGCPRLVSLSPLSLWKAAGLGRSRPQRRDYRMLLSGTSPASFGARRAQPGPSKPVLSTRLLNHPLAQSRRRGSVDRRAGPAGRALDAGAPLWAFGAVAPRGVHARGGAVGVPGIVAATPR